MKDTNVIIDMEKNNFITMDHLVVFYVIYSIHNKITDIHNIQNTINAV